MFKRYIGIDYSGAGTSTAANKKLAVCCAVRGAEPMIVPSPADGCDIRTRKGIAEWLVKRLKEQNTPTLVGIDHAFGFPNAYFEQYPQIPRDNWDCFLDDFREYWPTDEHCVGVRSQYYKQIKRMMGIELGDYRFGLADWFRLTEPCKPAASSVFDFMAGPRTVAYSTHAGIPWLRYIRQQLRDTEVEVRFWPFDCWAVPEGQSAVVEVYPALWNKRYKEDAAEMKLSDDQRDAYSIVRWLSEKDRNGSLGRYFNPKLKAEDRNKARMEGWIFGVKGPTYRVQG